jgi:hypothetical protein
VARIRWAKAVYCAGVDTWHVRIGGRHGEDPMFRCAGGEQQAKAVALVVNATLSRLVSERDKKKGKKD